MLRDCSGTRSTKFRSVSTSSKLKRLVLKIIWSASVEKVRETRRTLLRLYARTSRIAGCRSMGGPIVIRDLSVLGLC